MQNIKIIKYIILISALSLSIILFYYNKFNINDNFNFFDKKIKNNDKKIFIVNSNPSHSEVLMSIIYTLNKIPNYKISVYIKKLHFEINDIVKDFYYNELYDINKLKENLKENVPDTIILTTCEDTDIINQYIVLLDYMKLNPMMKIICIIHNPSHIENVKDIMSSFIDNRSIYLFSLSPHVRDYINKKLIDNYYLNNNNINNFYFVPIFNFEPAESCNIIYNISNSCTNKFTIQGLFEDERRDYQNIFKQMEYEINKNKKINFNILLLGHGYKPIFNNTIKKYITIKYDLEYRNYYEELHNSIGILPQFSNNKYYTEKSSSSVAASLITNTPLVANKTLLNSYYYLNPDVIYYQEDNENILSTIKKIKSFDESIIYEKRKNLTILTFKIINRNINLFKNIIDK